MRLSDYAILDLDYLDAGYNAQSVVEVEKKEPLFRMNTGKDVTIAEFATVSQGAITAHKLKDYRRKNYTLVLLPNIHTVLDDRFAPMEVVKGEILKAQGFN